MKIIKVLDGQSIFDIALMVAGSVEAAFDLAVENGLSITDNLMPGQLLQYSGTVINKRVVEHYKINEIAPATGNIETEHWWILACGFWDDEGVWMDDVEFENYYIGNGDWGTGTGFWI
jgi:hypothetical protein